MGEPVYCGLCLYGSDVGVPGYDDKGPAYINPACPDHNPEKEDPMTPESVLEAMAEALAEKYTPSDSLNEKPEQRLDEGMVVVFPYSDSEVAFRAVTPREVAVEAMNVVGPILEKLWEMKGLMEQALKLMGDWVQDGEAGGGPEFDSFLTEVGRLMAQLRVQEPADWDYVRRFSATPNEIHDILKSGLHPNVHLNYQQSIVKRALEEISEAVLADGKEKHDRSYSDNRIFYWVGTKNAVEFIEKTGPWPKDVVNP